MEPIERELLIYQPLNGKAPFLEWFDNLRDRQAKIRIDARLARLQEGNLGDFKPVADGVYEIRLVFGPGYRIYFAQDGQTIVLLLTGGDKGTQHTDIAKAVTYRNDYRSQNNA